MTLKEAYDNGFRDCLRGQNMMYGSYHEEEMEKRLVRLENKPGYDPPKEDEGKDGKK